MEKKKAKKSTIVLQAIFCAAVAVFIFFGDSILWKSCQDYASAGEYVRQQLAKNKDSFSFYLNCSKGGDELFYKNTVLQKLKEEVYAHTGDPAAGDHMVFRADVGNVNIVKTKEKGDSVKLLISVSPEYFTTKAQEQELAKAADSILTSLHIRDASDSEKALAIYRYICDNVKYDYDHLDDAAYKLQYTAYAAATQGTAVCAGIADLFYYLANSAGLDARIRINDDHAWNFVKVDGKYYYADATWDLGKTKDEYAYFLKGRADFEGHYGNVTFGLFNFSRLLVNTDSDYDFADFTYGVEPFKLK